MMLDKTGYNVSDNVHKIILRFKTDVFNKHVLKVNIWRKFNQLLIKNLITLQIR
jgi:hypothetical protein